MAEIITPNYFADGMRAFAAGRADKQARQADADRNAFRTLTPQALAGDLSARDQQYAIDPSAAQQVEQAGDAQMRRLKGAISFIENAQKAGRPEMVEAAYQQVRPYLARFGQQPPATFAEAEPMFNQARARIAMLDSAGTGKVFAQKIGADGFIYNAMADGSMVNTGVKADRQAWMRDVEGEAPTIINKDGSFTPVGQPGMPAAAPAQRAPGEVPFSIDPALPAPVQAAIRASEASGQPVPDTVQIASTAPGAGLAPKPTAAQKAAAEAQAKADVEYQNAGRMTQVEADRAGAVERAKAAAQADAAQRYGTDDTRKDAAAAAAKIPQVQNVARGLDRIENALAAIKGKYVDTGPVDQFVTRLTPEGQELNAAVQGIQESLLALTRVPGVGSQSDMETKIAGMKFPQLGNDPEVNRRTMASLRAFVDDIQNSIAQRAGGGQRAASADRPRNTALPVAGEVRRGWRYVGGDPSQRSSWEPVR